MKTLRFFVGFSMLLGLISSALPAAAAPAPATPPAPASTALLPVWLDGPATADAAAPATPELLPPWLAEPPAAAPPPPPPTALPDWFATASLPAGNAERHEPAPSGPGLRSVSSANLHVYGPTTANVCDTVTYTVVFTNDATPATNVQVVSAMPYPYSPSPQSCGPFNMAPNQVQSCVFAFAGGCAAVSGQNVVTLTQDGGPTIVRYTDLVVNPGAITVRKEPTVIPAYLEDVVTWTIYVENTGYGNVTNVVLTDVLGSGLAYVSGLTTTYISSMTVGQVLTFPVSAQVVGCSELANVVTGTWGCNGTTCLTPQTAIGSIDLQMRNPNLSYVLPTFDVPYCTGEQVFTIPLTNSGDGTAYSTTLTTDLSPFIVTTAPGVSYSGGAFHLPPILPAETYNLVFTLTLPTSPCATPTSGNFNFELLYYDRCDNPYYTLPQNAGWQLTNVPGDINLSKSMPPEVYRGQTVTATINVDITGISGTVIVTDTVPPGWTVIDTGGGVSFTVGGTTYITWELSASTTLTVVLLTPDSNAGGCAYCGTQMTNVVAALGTDCQNCARQATANASVYIQCDEGVSSDKQVSAPLVPCSDETFAYTNTYSFASSWTVTPAWGGLLFTETLPYQTYVSGTAWVWVSNGATGCLATFSETIVNGMLVISNISPTCAVDLPGATMQIGYQTRVGEPSACSDARWYDWSYLDLGVTGNDACAADGILEEGVFVETHAPQMRLSLSGLPPVVSNCGTYTVTLTAERTTPDIAAYDAVIDLVTDTFAVITVLGFGGVTPILTETNNSGYHWYYGDAFSSALTATVYLHVQLRCTDAAPFQATLYYDNLCANDEVYRQRCSAGGNLGNPLVAPCAPILTKFPEVIYATSDFVRWSLTVFNSGAGPAYNVVLTDTLGSGLRYVSSTITSTQGSVAGVVPLTSSQHVTWTLPVIQPKERVVIIYEAEIIGCDDLTNVFAGQQGCLGQTCQGGCAATSHVELPPTVLLNTNQFVSPIDTCYTRTVTVTVRNAGLLSVYTATVTETLPPGLYYVPSTTQVSTDTINWQAGPDPTINGQQLSWGPASGAPLSSWMARIRPYETVYIRFQTTASCPFAGGQIRVQTGYLDPCGTPHLTQASTYLMQSRAPQLTFVKVGQHLTRTHPSPELVYAEPGETVVWTITVANAGNTSPATNVVVTDILPYNAGFLTATPGYGLSAPAPGTLGGVVSWTVGLVNPGQTIVLTVTSVVSQPEGCDPVDTQNLARLSWGCDDGCRFTMQDDAYLRTVPVFEAIGLSADAGPRTLNQCGGVLTITLFNAGPPAYDVVLTDTLPSGFVYSDTLNASTWPATITDLGQIVVYTWPVLPSGMTTLVFRVRNATGSGNNCALPSGNNIIQVRYDDDIPDCLTSGPYTENVSYAISIVSPVLTINKTPPSQTVNVGEPVTWTLTVQNTGTGMAYNVVVTDVAGNSYVNVNATAGSDGAVPIIAGNAITWFPNPIPAGGTWTAQVTAVLTDTGDNVNRAWVRGGCDTGCVSSRDDDDAHTTLLQTFAKTPEVQTGTIGSLVVFYLEATLTDWDALYENLALTDALPAGLGYVSAVLTYTYDMDGSDGGPFGPVVIPPSSAPTPPGTGNVVWNLGNVSGTIQINGVITAVILNIPSNYEGVRLTNLFRMTYTDDGIPYQYEDTAAVDILEPLLHLGKTYITPSGCTATLLEENFNDGVANGWVASSGTWNVTQGEYRTASNNAARFAGDLTWTDYSFSAMLRSDATGTARSRPGLYVRYTNSNNYLRLYWTSNTNLRLEQRVGGVTTQLRNDNYPLTTNRWFHFEVRVVGNVVSIWIDGLPLGTPVPFNAALAAGRIGLHNNFASGTGTAISRFDDILVTRMGNMACTVGANDLVTYTLTISNQARIPAYDLVVVDVIPAGTSLFTYTMTSNDPTAAVVSQPAPIPGATGTLVWQINHLTPTAPFDPLNHTYINLQVVLQVSDGITANIVLANQAFLAYDGQEGNGPLNIERPYSGGSHSTAIRTVNGGIVKTVAFSPPPTATLGTVVAYTLIVPEPPISATLYNVTVSDTLDSRLEIRSVAVSGGTGGLPAWSGQTVTVTFASIPHHTQAVITITAVISDPLGAAAGDVIANTAQMIHATAPVTISNPVSTAVGEPLLALVKTSDPPTSSTVGAGDVITYQVTITNPGNPAGPAPAYDIVLSDTLPAYANDAAPTLLSITLDGSPVNPALYSTSYAGGVYTIVFTPTFAFSIPVGSVLVVRYTATVDADVSASVDLTNTAQVSWSSLPGATPGDRDYGPAADDTTLHTVEPTILKTVTPITATLGDVITYSIAVPATPLTATLYNVAVTDQLDGRLQLLTVTDGPDGSVLTAGNAFTITYPSIPAGQQRLITVTAILSSPLGAVAGDVITNLAVLTHQNGGPTPSNEPPFTVTEPALILVKASDPPTSSTVGAGDRVTYTVRITNSSGVTVSPAFDLVFTDTLPLWMRNAAPTLLAVTLDGTPVSTYVTGYNPTTGIFTVTFSPAFSIPVGSVLMIQYVATVDSNIPAGLDLTNQAEVTYSSLPGPVAGDRDYGPIGDTTTVHAGYPALDIEKSAHPSPVEAGAPLTYTLTVVNNGVVSATGVVVTDAVPTGTTYQSCGPLPCGEASGVVSWTLGTLNVGETRILTMLVLVDANLPDGSLLFNSAWVTSTEGITDTDDITTPVTTRADLAVVKSDDPDPVVAGETLVYTLVYTNYGPSDALGVVVSDTLPAEVLFVSASPAPAGGPNPLIWNLGAVPAGSGGQIVVTVTVQPWVTQTFTNAVVIASQTPDDNPGNNDDEEPTTPLIPGLTVVKTVLPGEAVPNMPFTYVIVITNTGQVRLDPVTLTDTLPGPDFHYIVGSATPVEPTVNPPLLVWPNLGALDPGESLTVTFAVTVTPGITGTFVNVALVAGEHPGGVITDTDDVPISIQDPAVEIAKHLVGFDTDIWAPNYVTFTIVITNIGVSPIDILPLYDIYDANYIHFAHSFPVTPDTVDNVNGQAVWLNLTGPAPHGFGHNLLPGEVFSLTTVFTVVQNITTPVTNTAIVSDVIDVYDNPAPPDDDDETIVDVPTAVTLRYFRAVGGERSIRLEWATAVEIDNFGFRLHRATAPLWAEAEELAFIPSLCQGNLCGAEYSYTDREIAPGVTCWYWLTDVDVNGIERRHGPVSAQSGLASTRYRLYLPLLWHRSTAP